MPVTIGSNITSLMAQRAFANATDGVSTAQERLASGMRINRASDDAAGLAISESLNTDSKVYAQALRNVNDGVSALTIAEAAIEELSGIVIRIRELATQSANGAISDTQRQSLDEEAQALSKEFTRIQQSTEFNGMGLLNGDTDGIRLQAGYGLDGSIKAGVGEYLADGSFQSGVTAASSAQFTNVEVADLNNDGTLDIIGADSSGNAVILMGKNNGGFTGPSSYGVGNSPIGLKLDDFNNDNILDLVTNNVNSADISVLIGNGNGSFQEQVSYGTGDTPFRSETGDFNGDGAIDIITTNYGEANLSILFGNGNGSFQDAVAHSAADGSQGIAVADFNSDGILDLATANTTGGDVTVMFGNGNGSFQNPATIPSYPGGSSPSDIKTSDLNGDGILDLAVTNSALDSVSILIGNQDGTFQVSNNYSTGTGSSPYSLEVADLNGDGVIDLATGNFADGNIGILFGNGNGSFKEVSDVESAAGTYGLAVGDLNGDGIQDLLSANFQAENILVMHGNSRDGVNPLLPFSLESRTEALASFSLLDHKLEVLNAQRGFIGSSQSRLSVAANVLQVSTENFKAAESRIKDADIAGEAAELIRTQILQQGAAAVLSQANQQPALALQLLG